MGRRRNKGMRSSADRSDGSSNFTEGKKERKKEKTNHRPKRVTTDRAGATTALCSCPKIPFSQHKETLHANKRVPSLLLVSRWISNINNNSRRRRRRIDYGLMETENSADCFMFPLCCCCHDIQGQIRTCCDIYIKASSYRGGWLVVASVVKRHKIVSLLSLLFLNSLLSHSPSLCRWII